MGEAYTKKGQNWRPESITLTSNNQTIIADSSINGKYTEIEGSNSLGLSYYSHIDIDRELLYQEGMVLVDTENNTLIVIERSNDIEPASFKQQISLTLLSPDAEKDILFGNKEGVIYFSEDKGNKKPIALITEEETSQVIEQKLLTIDLSLFNDKDLAESIISQFISEQVILFKEQSTPKPLEPIYKEIRSKDGRLIRIDLTDYNQRIIVQEDSPKNNLRHSQINFRDLYLRYMASSDTATEDISLLKVYSEDDVRNISIRCDCSSPIKSICVTEKYKNKTKTRSISYNQEGMITINNNGQSSHLPIDIDYDNIPKSLLAKIIYGEILSSIPFFIFEQDDELAKRILTQFLDKNCARVLGIRQDIEKQKKRT